jgi:alginate O-acetyltransferase complex protein AlgI
LGFEVQTLQIILPVGISFYTFQTLSYTLDIFFKKLKPTKNFTDFALFVSFFPQLIAGPIIRAHDFLPQLRDMRRPSQNDIFSGFVLFTFGLFKKVLIADNLAKISDVIFANPGAFDGITTWISVISYTVQIYCDFSGYSDMAIGLARMMGFRFSKNFNYPYIAKRIDEFWRRWHISLASWLRDYLYIPLGGSRRGRGRTYVNVMITMLLGGLWHGARWNFVVWGLWHGLNITAVKVIDDVRGPVSSKRPIGSYLGWAGSMLIVLIGWVLFRVQRLGDAWVILRQMFWPQPGVSWVNPSFFVLIAFVVASHVLHLVKIDLRERMRATNLASAAAICSMWLLTYVFYPTDFAPFIYFQF